jgi:adenylate cyclase
MAVETERKFLVKGEFRHLAVRKSEIIQTYLTIDRDKTIRVRIIGDRSFLTIKSRPFRNLISRHEWETEIPVKDAREMMEICLPGKVVKTRYLIPYGDQIFEVDEFHDKNEGLVIAELELSSESDHYEKPVWLGEEVTGKPEYYNANLIK